MEAELLNCKAIEIDELKTQNYENIKSKLLENNENFEDPLFPKNFTSIGQVDDRPELAEVKWMRVGEIAQKMGKKPVLFTNGAKSSDIVQGKVKDCWFLAALGDLPNKPKLFNRVMPTDQELDMSKGPGIFYFKFWQYGEWVEVVVDDYLPTLEDLPCMLKSSSPNEFWPCMLEKAYAKLYGNYTYALQGGVIGSALDDLTGGMTESYFKQEGLPTFQVMLRAFEKGAMMGASIFGRVGQGRSDVSSTGLANFHAYSITKVVEFESGGETHQLLRVRNPWGDHVEWIGNWSDNSKKWDDLTETEKLKIGYKKEYDGEFFISYKDFIKYFDGVEICHISGDSINEVNMGWHEEEVHGSWEVAELEKIHKNPQYLVELLDSDADADDNSTFIVSVLQKGAHRKRAEGVEYHKAFQPIGLVILPVHEEELPLDEATCIAAVKKPDAKIAHLQATRANTNRFVVTPGKYIMLPFIKKDDADECESTEFMLRLFSEMPATLKLVN